MRLEESVVVGADADAVWKVVGDPCALGRLSELMIVTPLDEDAEPGVGARYRVLLKVGAVPVGGNVEIIEHTPARDLSWTTLTGVDHRLRLRLRETPHGTRLTLRFGYDSPGVLGTVADVAAFFPIRGALRELLHRVQRAAEH